MSLISIVSHSRPPALTGDSVPSEEVGSSQARSRSSNLFLISVVSHSLPHALTPRARCMPQAALYEQFVAPPLVAKLTPLSDLSEDISNAMREQLREFELAPLHLRLARIRGDGHCLFRAIAASLVLGAAWGGHSALDCLADHLAQVAPEHVHVADALQTLLTGCAADCTRALAQVNEVEPSDMAVEALRRCAMSHMCRHEDRFCLCSSENEDFDAYCERMQGMGAAPAYGGHSEVVALSEALSLRVEIVDCSGITELQLYRMGEQLPQSCPTIYLLRRGLHYHLMLSASAEGECIDQLPQQ